VQTAPDVERAAPLLAELLQPGDCVLVKASRAMGLEQLAEAIAGAPV
jgi:UDP-N-acetylmuramyl pentapeptide synthase